MVVPGPTQPNARSNHLAGIEGLRAVAACSIMVFHVWFYAAPDLLPFDLGPVNRIMDNLPAGVTLFFTLSGFLLYRPFAAALLRGGPAPRSSAYLRNRALRILPAYWVILLAVALLLNVALIRTSAETLDYGSLADRPLLLLSNALLIQNYHPSTFATGIGPAWSLAIECAFYLTLPLVAALPRIVMRDRATLRQRRRAALVPPLTFLAVGLCGKALALALTALGVFEGERWLGNWFTVYVLSIVYQADLFTFGMLLAVLQVEVQDGRIRLPGWWSPVAAAGCVGLALPVAWLWSQQGLSIYVYEPATALACGLLLALVVLPTGAPGGLSWLARRLEWRPLAWLGMISYSLFLWHEPLIYWLRGHGLTSAGAAGFVWSLVLVSIVAILLSAVTYRLVERPALSLKARTARGERTAPAAAVRQAW